MASEAKHCKVWSIFERQGRNGIIKLRIQDLPKSRMDDFMRFILTYFVQDESMHKAAGIAKSEEALKEYKEVLAQMYELHPPEISICCLDNDPENFDEILAVSTVQVMSNKVTLEDSLKEMGFQPKCKELESMISILMALQLKVPESIKKKYELFYEGRGIIVHPGYRGLGIATEIVKQRRSMCNEQVPMTCAWMTSLGSQKAAAKVGWETVAEVPIEELANLTSLDFGNSPSYKLMMATAN